MATLREFILAGSSLATGNTIRDHLNNQVVGGGGSAGTGLPFPVQQSEVNFGILITEVNFTKVVNEVTFKDTTQEVNINLDSVGVDNVI